MFFQKIENGIIARKENELIQIEAWGKNALRVRATQYPNLSGENWALEPVKTPKPEIQIDQAGATVRNGKLKVYVSDFGRITFYKEDTEILTEHYRCFCSGSPHTPSTRIHARQFKPHLGGDYRLTVRFESNDGEQFFGMGQYQQSNLNLKGCMLELAQRNSQITIPFALSSRSYGFLWNNPGIGRVTFGENITQWETEVSAEMDYWITADDTPKQIVENYTAVTGRAPIMPENVMGLWQSKLRYRTQEETLEVAREYQKRGIPLDVIVVDYFHWNHLGDWAFDKEYWPDPKAMVDELKDMGTRCMVSTWPSVDKRSENYAEMQQKGLLVRVEKGSPQTCDFLADSVYYDATNPEAREFLWDKIKQNYYKYGIDLFWLDVAEPEYLSYDFDAYRYYLGPNLKVGNLYPVLHTKAFYDGLKAEQQEGIVNLVRSAWVGSQKYGALVWSGDIYSNFDSLRDQFAAGLNIGIAGIPWWTTDTGGFFGDVTDPDFPEVLIRWFQYSTFSPVLRMHGDRSPHTIPKLAEGNTGGGFCETGLANELWSFGEKPYEIMKHYLDIRLSMKEYIKQVMDEAHENGSPAIRTMFYEFPADKTCWEISDQYMFGPSYLVAPVLYKGMTSRPVYLPEGTWENIHDHTVYQGGQTIQADAPLEIIPVYKRLDA